MAGCVTSTPILYEEAANPKSTTRKIVAHHVKRWTTRPVTKFEKRFDFNKNGRLDPDELLRFRMASGYYHRYGNVWKFDKNKDFRFDQEEYYDATRGGYYEEGP
jgi:hypothetical protein